MQADVIILSNTINYQFWEMTQYAIDTLHYSEEHDHEFNVLVVETNSSFPYKSYYSSMIFPSEQFNYNRFLNLGINYLTNELGIKSDYLIIANNDLIFHQGWFSEILKAMEEYDLDSASPRSPGWFTQNSLDESVHLGYEVGQLFCGWCLVFRRESLDKLLPLDEQFVFWCQDNDMAIQAQKLGQRHALVGSSKVTHLANQSHNTVDPTTFKYYTDGMVELFHKKINESKNQ